MNNTIGEKRRQVRDREHELRKLQLQEILDRATSTMEIEENEIVRYRDTCDRYGKSYKDSPQLIYHRARLMGMISLAETLGIHVDRFKWVYNIYI